MKNSVFNNIIKLDCGFNAQIIEYINEDFNHHSYATIIFKVFIGFDWFIYSCDIYTKNSFGDPKIIDKYIYNNPYYDPEITNEDIKRMVDLINKNHIEERSTIIS